MIRNGSSSFWTMGGSDRITASTGKSWTALLLVSVWIATCSAAAVPHFEVTPIEVIDVAADLSSSPAVLTPTPTPTPATILRSEKLRRRDDEDEDETTESGEGYRSKTTLLPTTTSGSSIVSKSTMVLSITPPSTKTDEAPSTLPSPMDTSLALGFTNSDDSCPIFLKAMLQDAEFKDCYPMSLMVNGGSRSFFEASGNLLRLVQVLDTACESDVESCKARLDTFAEDLKKDENCGSEFQRENSVVMQAYKGLRAYETLYSATCLQDPETSQYCYANAVTNLTTPSNAYVYFLPLNNSLPGSATPTCGWCLEETMGIFQAASANRDLYIASTYEQAAQQVNTVCGPEYVNATLPEPDDESFAAITSIPSWAITFTSTIAISLAIGFG